MRVICRATGKICHDSKAHAREVVRQLRRRQETASLYLCESCRRWHVTGMAREDYRRHVRGIGPAMRGDA